MTARSVVEVATVGTKALLPDVLGGTNAVDVPVLDNRATAARMAAEEDRRTIVCYVVGYQARE